MLKTLILLAFSLSGMDAFVPRTKTSTASSTALSYQNDKTDIGVAESPALPTEKRVVVVQRPRKPTIYSLSSLDELYEFLQEDDDRLTAIK